nr:GH3 auxin-responsive promoter family protein [Candidatus Njordarchaeum guaymaensis]
MEDIDLWRRYCSFYEKDFSEQIAYNRKRMERYFEKWRKTQLAKLLCHDTIKKFKDVPITTYNDYHMLSEFGRKISDATRTYPRKHEELFKDYYDRLSREVGSWLDRYMTEPLYLCMKTTGTTGQSKWVVHGETFWKNFESASIATAVVACSDTWGETKARVGDKALNMNAPIPYISGWGAFASQKHFELIPSIEVSDNLRDMREKFNIILRSIKKGEKITMGGGIGSLFYMICKYFVAPEEFYTEYYHSMGFGLRKTLLYLKMLQCKLSSKERNTITDFVPLKGVLVAGMEAGLYIEFFKEEFNLEPLHIYGSTEAGPLMRGDPDRKTDLVPDLRTSYLEFKTENGDTRDLDELRKGEIYDLVVTPFGSILFRYDMEDLLRVIDFRDDGMPIFSFESRKTTVIRLYEYDVTSNTIVQALSKAGLRSSDKWAVAKLLKPREHLHFLMEKGWPYSEKEAERIIFDSLMKAEESIQRPDETLLRDYVRDFGIRDPSDVIRVEYLRPGAFLRYTILMSKRGVPIGQYKPPKIILPEKMEIYETLRNA